MKHNYFLKFGIIFIICSVVFVVYMANNPRKMRRLCTWPEHVHVIPPDYLVLQNKLTKKWAIRTRVCDSVVVFYGETSYSHGGWDGSTLEEGDKAETGYEYTYKDSISADNAVKDYYQDEADFAADIERAKQREHDKHVY